MRYPVRLWTSSGRDRPAMYFGGDLGDVGPVLWLGIGGRGGQVGAVTCHGALDHFAEVVPDMPSIGHLQRLWRSSGSALGVGTGSVPADDLHARVGSQPRREGLGGPIAEYLDRAAGLQIYQDRSVMVPATQGEVLDAQHLRNRIQRIGQRPDLAQWRHPAHGRGQLPGQPRSSAAAQCRRDRAQRPLQD